MSLSNMRIVCWATLLMVLLLSLGAVGYGITHRQPSSLGLVQLDADTPTITLRGLPSLSWNSSGKVSRPFSTVPVYDRGLHFRQLRRQCQHPDPAVRIATLELFGTAQFKDPTGRVSYGCIQAMRAALEDPDSVVRLVATNNLATLRRIMEAGQ